jgi:putative hydrolase of the HAD superfamily
MSALSAVDIRGIIFDLDGTLYVNDRFAAEILEAAVAYIAEVKRISLMEAGLVMTATRSRLTEESGSVQTISAVCSELGGNIQDLHRFFGQALLPELYLVPDTRVIKLLDGLARRFSLYIYTNNNRPLATRILNFLGLEGVVSDLFTIDDSWRGKPDEEMVLTVLAKTGLLPHEALFVGDRYDVDLRVPEQLGCPVFLSQSLEQLLRLEELLANRYSPAIKRVITG